MAALALGIAPAAYASGPESPPAGGAATAPEDDRGAGDETCGSGDDRTPAPAAAPATPPPAEPAALAPPPAPAAPAPDPGPAAGPAAPRSAEATTLSASVPLVTAVRAHTVGRRRVLRLRVRLARAARLHVGFRRLPTGTLMQRRFARRAGVVTLALGRGLRPGRYRIRVTAVDGAGHRTSVRVASLRVAG
jgi:hypothetical protein